MPCACPIDLINSCCQLKEIGQNKKSLLIFLSCKGDQVQSFAESSNPMLNAQNPLLKAQNPMLRAQNPMLKAII